MLPNKHQRGEIRAVVNTILSGNTTAGNNVFPNRYNQLEKDSLPAICIYTGKEQSDIFNSQMLKRTLTLSLEIHSSQKTEDAMIEELELIAGECEILILQNEDLSGKCDQITLISTDIATKNDGDELIGAALMSYNVEYYTSTAVDTPNDPLEGTDLKYENDTTGKVDLPQ